MKPITPAEVIKKTGTGFPDSVFESFNELIRDFRNGSVTVAQDEVLKMISARTGLNRQTVCDNGWLDIEGAYRIAGWVVEYDKPGFNETYPATFKFKKRY